MLNLILLFFLPSNHITVSRQPETYGYQLPENYSTLQNIAPYPDWFVDNYLEIAGTCYRVENGAPTVFELQIPGFEHVSTWHGSISGYEYNYYPKGSRGPTSPYLVGVEVKVMPSYPRDSIPDDSGPLYCLTYQIRRTEGYVLIDTTGVDEIDINGYTAYRLRGYSIWGQCDYWDVAITRVTAYLVPTEIFDYYITCYNTVYEHYSGCGDGIVYDEDFTDEQYDSLIAAYEAYYPKEYRHPDRIRQLEQAVEQSFRVK